MPAKGWPGSKFKGAMCLDIIQMFSKGRSRSHFCSKYNISQHTFHDWLRKYPVFKDAYDVALEKAKAYFDDVGMDHLIEEHKGPRLNTRLYEMMLRNRFGMPQTRMVQIQGMASKDPQDKLNAICHAVEAGQLTADEAAKLGTLVASSISTQEYSEFADRVYQLELAQELDVNDKDFKRVDS